MKDFITLPAILPKVEPDIKQIEKDRKVTREI